MANRQRSLCQEPAGSANQDGFKVGGRGRRDVPGDPLGLAELLLLSLGTQPSGEEIGVLRRGLPGSLPWRNRGLGALANGFLAGHLRSE